MQLQMCRCDIQTLYLHSLSVSCGHRGWFLWLVLNSVKNCVIYNCILQPYELCFSLMILHSCRGKGSITVNSRGDVDSDVESCCPLISCEDPLLYCGIVHA